MRIGAWITSVAIAAGFAAVGPAAATPWTFTTSGTIFTGVDGLGLFGPAYASLVGLGYSLTTEIADPAANAANGSSATESYSYGGPSYGATSAASFSVTVNGVTVTRAFSVPDYNDAWVKSYGEVSGHVRQDGGPTKLEARQQAYSLSNDFVPGTGLFQSIEYVFHSTDDRGFAFFDFTKYATSSDPFNSTSFEGTPDRFVLNAPGGPATDLPEPASILLLSLGLIGIVGLRHR
mgnify:CR=1 FL=1